MKIVAISDVHGKWNKLKIPECDILISVGDYSFRGEEYMVREYHEWLNKQDARCVISIQGNHEKWVEKNFTEAKEIAQKACSIVHFVDEGLVEFEGLKIWCSAITPFFCNWAWNRYRGEEIKRHWDRIPAGVDIIATHGPAYGIHDKLDNHGSDPGAHVGCQDLLNKILEVKPKIHLCGHIHCGHGYQKLNDIEFFNVSVCGETYQVDHPPTVIEI